MVGAFISSLFSLVMNQKELINDVLINKKFFALAIDQGTSLKEIINQKKNNFKDEDYFFFKKNIIEILGSNLSAVLFDFETYEKHEKFKNLNIPKIIAYEDDAYNIDNVERITKLPTNKSIDKTIDDFKAIKFFMYYNPDSPQEINNKKNILIKKIGKMCLNLNKPFLFEPLLYNDPLTKKSNEEYNKKKHEYIKYFYSEFSKPDYNVSIIKIEFPFNESILDDYNNVNTINYCEEILLNTFGKTMKPFVFLSAGMKFSNFYKSMSISMKLNINCLGFLCGRSLWQDSIDIFCNQSNTEFIKWLENQGLERVEKLKSTLDL